MTIDHLAPVVIAFFLAIFFVLALHPMARETGLVDQPGGRKRHIGAIPMVGGVAMFAGLLFTLPMYSAFGAEARSFLLAAALLVTIGMLDDRFDLKPSVRLVGQTCAVMIAIFGAGAYIGSIGDPFGFGAIGRGPVAFGFTVLTMLTVINAYNMMDGVDGLCGVLAFVALLGCATLGGAHSWAPALMVLLAVIAGFLVFNLPLTINRGVRTFMGDAGSTFLGFAVVFVVVQMSQGAGAVMAPVVGLFLAALPLYDLFISMLRRMANGRSPFAADRQHIHHVLQRAGFSGRITLLILAALAMLYMLVGVIGTVAGASDGLLFGLWVAFGVGHFLLMSRAPRFIRWARTLSRRLATDSA